MSVGVVSNTFSPLVTAVTMTVSSKLVTKTYNLPAQITPFEPPSTCRVRIMCGVPASSLTAGAVCNAFDYVDSTSARGVMSECHPQSYSDIIFPQSTAFDDVKSLAYPGTACPKGLQRACTTTLSFGEDTYPQTWCCPDGYQCVNGARQCRSVISANTALWVQPDSTLQAFESVSITGLSSQQTIQVIRDAFWLIGGNGDDSDSASSSSSSASETAGASSSRTSGVSSTSGPAQTSASGNGTAPATETSNSLSQPQLAGVAAGSTIAALVLIGAVGFMFFRRRRNNINAANNNNGQNERGDFVAGAALGKPGSSGSGNGNSHNSKGGLVNVTSGSSTLGGIPDGVGGQGVYNWQQQQQQYQQQPMGQQPQYYQHSESAGPPVPPKSSGGGYQQGPPPSFSPSNSAPSYHDSPSTFHGSPQWGPIAYAAQTGIPQNPDQKGGASNQYHHQQQQQQGVNWAEMKEMDGGSKAMYELSGHGKERSELM